MRQGNISAFSRAGSDLSDRQTRGRSCHCFSWLQRLIWSLFSHAVLILIIPQKCIVVVFSLYPNKPTTVSKCDFSPHDFITTTKYWHRSVQFSWRCKWPCAVHHSGRAVHHRAAVAPRQLASPNNNLKSFVLQDCGVEENWFLALNSQVTLGKLHLPPLSVYNHPFEQNTQFTWHCSCSFVSRLILQSCHAFFVLLRQVLAHTNFAAVVLKVWATGHKRSSLKSDVPSRLTKKDYPVVDFIHLQLVWYNEAGQPKPS